MSDDSFLPFDLPAVSRKKVCASFDGGAISSDGDLLLLREADRRLGLTRMLASCMQDRREPSRISRAVEEILLFHMLAIPDARRAESESAGSLCEQFSRPYQKGEKDAG